MIEHPNVEDIFALLKIREKTHTIIIIEAGGILMSYTAKSAKGKIAFKRNFMGVVGIYTNKIKKSELVEDIEATKKVLQII